MELAKAYRSENAACRQGLDGVSQCLRRTYCVWGPVPCVEECSMNNADENPYQPGGTVVFGLQFKYSAPRKSRWVEFDQTPEGVWEWTVPIPGKGRSRWRGQCDHGREASWPGRDEALAVQWDLPAKWSGAVSFIRVEGRTWSYRQAGSIKNV